MISKTVDESRVETVHIVRPNHLNGANRLFGGILRSEERRVGKECRSRWSPYH